ncbi:hypothetical protein GEMRC1_003668 [Eukaryota sp. GEM-RC1]
MLLGGPLVRVCSEHHNEDVHLAVLVALKSLFVSNGTSMKAFVGPLQTAIFKPLSSPSKKVRNAAVELISFAIEFSRRVDPFVIEVNTRMFGDLSASIKYDYLIALSHVFYKVGTQISTSTRQQSYQIIIDHLAVSYSKVNYASAQALSSYLYSADKDEFAYLLDNVVLDVSFGTEYVGEELAEELQSAQLMLFRYILQKIVKLSDQSLDEMFNICMKRFSSAYDSVREPLVKAIEGILLFDDTPTSLQNQALDQLAFLVTDESPVVRHASLLTCYRLALFKKELLQRKLLLFMPGFLAGIQVRNTEQRKRAEYVVCLVLETDRGNQGVDDFRSKADQELGDAVMFYFDKILTKIDVSQLRDVDSSAEVLML